jgi:hypothetical protein
MIEEPGKAFEGLITRLKFCWLGFLISNFAISTGSVVPQYVEATPPELISPLLIESEQVCDDFLSYAAAREGMISRSVSCLAATRLLAPSLVR